MGNTLTDERIIKALEAVEKETIAFSYDKEQRRFEYVTGKELLNLIHHLQEEKKELQESADLFNHFNEKLDGVIAEAKGKIERLMEEIDQRREMMHRMDCNYATELQKQVDELKAENTELYKEHTTLIAGSILEKQNIVKNTAKEILQQLWDETEPNTKSHEWVRKRIKEIAESKDVEVE